MAPTADNSVQSALDELNFLEATQLISRDESSWNEYKVDSGGTRVRVLEGSETTADIMLGRFEYKQTGMMSYVRPSEDEETYMVSGYLDASFQQRSQ